MKRPRLAVLAMTLAVSGAAHAQDIGWHEDFEGDWMDRWTTQRLASRPTEFHASVYGGEAVLRVVADRSAGALIRPVRGVSAPLRLTWRWLLDSPLAPAELPSVSERERGGDDYAARVFVIFGAELADAGTRALCYVWAREEPPGSVYPSPVAERIQMVVLRTGAGEAGSWQQETIDPAADYRAIFGTDPPAVGAIALMSDSDDTVSRTTVLFDDVAVELGTSGPAADNRHRPATR